VGNSQLAITYGIRTIYEILLDENPWCQQSFDVAGGDGGGGGVVVVESEGITR
jgi:hypothetical protein